MASVKNDEDTDEFVTIICTDSDSISDGNSPHHDDIVLSVSCISNWDLPSTLPHKLLKIQANSNRLIEESSYFRGLLSGRFSESRLNAIRIQWDVATFVSVLQCIFGCQVEISADNFVSLNEAALFFGVETLLLKCQAWLEEVTAKRRFQSPQLCLDDLIHIWDYASEHANGFILQLCASYLARNFMWALSCNSYTDVPDKLMSSCISNPDLTVESERHLCDAILVWLTAKTTKSQGWKDDIDHEKLYIDHIRAKLLPLWFVAGKKRCCFVSDVAEEAITTIHTLTKFPRMSLSDIFTKDDLSSLRIRLTIYAEKLDLSGCPQMTPEVFLLSVLPTQFEDLILRKSNKKTFVNHHNTREGDSKISQALGQTSTFKAVREVDISNCPSFPLELALDCLCKSFPSLRILKAAYFWKFRTTMLCQLVHKFPVLADLDLTLDIDPVIPTHVSVISSFSINSKAQRSTASLGIYGHSAVSFSYTSTPLISNIMKLTLEGRNDISDSDLQKISEVCVNLNYVNIRGCTSVTDCGISSMILTCKQLQSIVACDTSFGSRSILALCAGNSSEPRRDENNLQFNAYKLLDLHIGGCCGIDGGALSKLLSGADGLRTLCLREIQPVDDALYKFPGTSLETLNVSNTKVSISALSQLICRNPDLKCLKTRGCTNLGSNAIKFSNVSYSPEELYIELGKYCKLEEIEVGWGLSIRSIERLKPAIRTLRTIVIGLGGSLGEDGLNLLPTICPLLETLVLYFQVISDSVIVNITKALPHLQFLSLSYCFGDISPTAFALRMPNLRNLKLERVTPWLTNRELATLGENCACLIKLSLMGCPLLNSESQDIISNCWPGLISLHLEECGEITASGVGSLFNCHALEDLVLRHTGAGIPRNFIMYAASKLPMLRKLSLDVCDSREHDLDIPTFTDDRYFLRIVKIARCKLQKSSLGLQHIQTRSTPVHKESLVLVWNSEKLVRTVVKERL